MFASRIRKFASISSPHRFSTTATGIHHSQTASFTDSLIRVDSNDMVIGRIPKLESHLAAAINSGIIHRAFSVFLFSADDRSLLIQKRSPHKIVFPREWANTCCSHPLYVDSEMENVDGNQIGAKRAATKRLNSELGIAAFPEAGLSFKEKILYSQLSPGGTFGESECDYILVGQLDRSSYQVNPVPDEVEETAWIEPGPKDDRTLNLREFLKEQRLRGFPPTPWFELMVKEKACLESWWTQLIENPDTFLKTEDVNRGEVRNFLRK